MTGGCACGAVRYRPTSEPLFVHCCNCRNCRRQTGSAFVVNVPIEADRVELVGGQPRALSVPRDDGSTDDPPLRGGRVQRAGAPAAEFVRAVLGR